MRVVAFVDFNPGGGVAADSFVDHLARYGVTTKVLTFLIRPERFTKVELHEYAYCLRPSDRRQKTLQDHWLESSGGVDGQALGIHANHLTSVDRLTDAFHNDTGLSQSRRAAPPLRSRQRLVRYALGQLVYGVWAVCPHHHPVEILQQVLIRDVPAAPVKLECLEGWTGELPEYLVPPVQGRHDVRCRSTMSPAPAAYS